MGSSAAIRRVTLPNGIEAIEVEHKEVGGSETQLWYEYFDPIDETKMVVLDFDLGYWGEVKDTEPASPRGKKCRVTLRL